MSLHVQEAALHNPGTNHLRLFADQFLHHQGCFKKFTAVVEVVRFDDQPIAVVVYRGDDFGFFRFCFRNFGFFFGFSFFFSIRDNRF